MQKRELVFTLALKVSFFHSFICLIVSGFSETIYLHTVVPLLGADFVTGRRAFVNEGGG